MTFWLIVQILYHWATKDSLLLDKGTGVHCKFNIKKYKTTSRLSSNLHNLTCTGLAPAVQTLDTAIRRKNCYRVDKC